MNGRPGRMSAPTPKTHPGPAETPVPIGPVPTGFAVNQATGSNGSLLIVLQVFTPTGPQHYFMPGEVASQLGKALSELGAMSASGLVSAAGSPLPGAGAGGPGTPPPGQP